MQEKESDQYCVILTTAGSREEADRLSEWLVSSKLAACVQITRVDSCYIWKGKLTREAEYLLLIKTAAHLYAKVETAILEKHSYEIPEIIQLPVTRGLERYFNWITENTI